MLGMALEGGGARGAYHIGVVKAYIDNGYVFNGFVGTSIGSVNAAVLAQGDFDKALRLWENLSMDRLFDVDDEALIEFNSYKFNKSFLTDLKNSLKKIITGGGVDTAKMRAVLEGIVDEKKVRASKKDFGLVTVSINERKPYELFLEDIPDGLLIHYIMASASFPGFKPEIINDLPFIDGGLYNNCPVNMLLGKNYDEIIAVRTLAPGIFRTVKPGNAKITIISPYDNLGNIMIFSREQTEVNILLGYYDGLRAIKKLLGRFYYINPVKENEIEHMLLLLNDNVILKTGEVLGFSEIPPKRMLFEHIIPKLAKHLELSENFDYKDFIVALFENSAKRKKIERFKVYGFDEFLYLLKNAPPVKKDESEKLFDIKSLRAAQIIVRALLPQNPDS